MPVIIHLAETEDEVRTAAREVQGDAGRVSRFARASAGPRTLAAHGVHLTPADIQILAKRKVGVSHNPESNMKLASGTAPVPALRKAGVPVGLGTDGAASNNDLDMFEAMRQAALLHKLASKDPRTLPAGDVLGMATIEGASATRPGPARLARSSPASAPTSSSSAWTPPGRRRCTIRCRTSSTSPRGDDVRTTIVNGKVLMRDRRRC